MLKGPDIFAFTDYRNFLREYYRMQKENGRGFSFRSFARRAGLRTPNHLKRVMEGDRNLSPGMAVRFASAIGLGGDDARYFCELVAFNQAQTNEERQTRYETLNSFRGFRRAQKLDLSHAAFHSRWYIPAIRELIGRRDFRSDPKWIARQLVPRISVAEVKEALAILSDLNLIAIDGNDSITQTEAVVSTGPDTEGVHIVRYHETMMQRSIAALDLVEKPYRDVSSITLRLDEDGLVRAKKRLVEFRRELIGLEDIDGPGSGDIVVQINFQLYPLSAVNQEEPCD